VKALLDTNILIDYLQGIDPARKLLKEVDDHAISIITWMEVLVGAGDECAHEALEAFLNTFVVLPLSDPIARRAVELRRRHRIRLPDAIIWATADVHQRVLITRNTRDFPRQPGVFHPYRLT